MLSELPPTIRIIEDEGLLDYESPAELARSIEESGLRKELQQQAEWSVDGFAYEGVAPSTASGDEIVLAPTGYLNPFSAVLKCFNPACRAKTAQEFALSVGLYADRVVLRDSFTSMFMGEGPRKSADYLDIYANLVSLKTLLPLLKEGIISFGPPVNRVCSTCYEKCKTEVREATNRLVESAREETIVEPVSEDNQREILVILPSLSPDVAHPLSVRLPLTDEEVNASGGFDAFLSKERKPAASEIVERALASHLDYELHFVVDDLILAHRTRAVLAGGSRVEVLYLRQLERLGTRLSEVDDWERLRSLDLPWFHGMTVDEVLRLRNEAKDALPRLRTMLASRLCKGEQDDVQHIIAELREQVSEVRRELAMIDPGGRQRFKVGLSGLAMSFVIYGLMANPGAVATGIAALIASLTYLHKDEREVMRETIKVTGQPAYALVQAVSIRKGPKGLT